MFVNGRIQASIAGNVASFPAGAINEHAKPVAEKIEDPYSALAALLRLVKDME